MTPKEVLRKAAGYIQSHGLARGTYGEVDGPCCIVGAMAVVLGMAPAEDSDELDEAIDLFKKRAGFKTTGDIMVWVDDKKATKKSVVAALREAAK